jgi:hypothetical protein
MKNWVINFLNNPKKKEYKDSIFSSVLFNQLLILKKKKRKTMLLLNVLNGKKAKTLSTPDMSEISTLNQIIKPKILFIHMRYAKWTHN